jgi:hypothetical protein
LRPTDEDPEFSRCALVRLAEQPKILVLKITSFVSDKRQIPNAPNGNEFWIEFKHAL